MQDAMPIVWRKNCTDPFFFDREAGMNWFIWGAYGVTFTLLFIEVVLLFKRTRETKA